MQAIRFHDNFSKSSASNKYGSSASKSITRVTFFFIILSREYSKAKNCAQELLEKECPEHANSRTYYMDVLFDNYNPFCKNFLYNAPTTVKTPPRKTERLVMTQRREPSSCKSCPRATSIVMNSARSNREKSSYISVFELWFVLFYSQLCHSLLI